MERAVADGLRADDESLDVDASSAVNFLRRRLSLVVCQHPVKPTLIKALWTATDKASTHTNPFSASPVKASLVGLLKEFLVGLSHRECIFIKRFVGFQISAGNVL